MAILWFQPETPKDIFLEILKNGHNPTIWPPIQKNKETLFSSTLKVEEYKVSLFFSLEVKWEIYDKFAI